MKKVLHNPFVIALILLVFFASGVLVGRHSTTTVAKLVVSDDPVQPDADQTKDTMPEEYIVGDKIDINVAPAEVFATFPGIGDVLAQRIVSYREEHGPFASVDDLLNVEGIGENKLNAMRQYLTVN